MAVLALDGMGLDWQEGRAALERINKEMGLSFDDADLDLYTEMFTVKVHRPHRSQPVARPLPLPLPLPLSTDASLGLE